MANAPVRVLFVCLGNICQAGFGILDHEQRKENWRTAVVRLKTIVEPHGVKFPALPEIGVDGEDVAFDPEKIVPIF